MALLLLDTFAGRLLLTLVVVALIIVAIVRREARASWLVRTGAVVLFVTFGLLAALPSLLTGLLFSFSAPVAILLIVLGAIGSFVRGDGFMNRDIARLAAAARGSNRIWPDHPPLAEVDRVARHGPRAGPTLVSRLHFESEEQRDDTWSPAVEQQLELALCRIYGETPSGARTVYDIRASAPENARVKPFWEAKIRSKAGQPDN